ncbi:NADPH-dependent ferric siderophore reductase, contains FAD-binding and SIP domains [Devosia sp. YR412]|uniref:siderophore-interacting protein n=1 Tax=Devosia sp. YR412 TaxID=1881030 RepID=UPI0008C045F4|nr:siderophore-interacting protein [Devosia sp. YR412]SEQ54684.1 NADPH-dependent ferric siderophore reductase, contains FAD-binding and SIP domains [Devosia sp. YR412]
MSRMFHEARVLSRQQLTPGMLRLTLGGAGLSELTTTGIGDEYLRLFFPNEKTGKLHLPVITDNGRWTYPDGQDAIRCSTYTVRRYRADPVEIDVDFVIHEGGLACAWALDAKVGDTVTINRPRGLYSRPADALWQLLVCDATGLPALSRILEQTPRHIESRMFVEVASAEDELVLPHHPAAKVTWLHKSGNGVAPSRMGEVVGAVPLPRTPGYIWVAGEQKVVRSIRKFVRQELRLPPERYELVGYWTANGADWDAKWAALDPAIKAQIAAGWNSGRDAEVVRDEYEDVLEKFGL